MKYKYFFTVTAGRTGSAWLTEFLGANLAIKSIHEPLDIEDFGVRMPDIKLMRTFNMFGNTAFVRDFYKHKLDDIAALPAYAETNHTLAKCGLVENLAEHDIASHSCLIVLRRDFVKQCVSYINRGDFRNITIDWQWYLHESYRNNIINYAPFEKHGLVGRALWYVYEMDARQRYYERLFADKIKIISTTLEEITTEAGAGEFLKQNGHEGEIILSEAQNTSRVKATTELTSHVRQLIDGVNYDVDGIVAKYLENGMTLSLSERA